jgi:hypothetical protein
LLGGVFAAMAVSATTRASACPTKRALSSGSRGYGAEARFELDLVRVGRHRPEWNRLQAVARDVLARQHRQDARQGARRARIDAADACMRVRRAHHAGIRLTREVEVVGVAAAAAQKTSVLLACHRLANALARARRSGLQKGHSGP